MKKYITLLLATLFSVSLFAQTVVAEKKLGKELEKNTEKIVEEIYSAAVDDKKFSEIKLSYDVYKDKEKEEEIESNYKKLCESIKDTSYSNSIKLSKFKKKDLENVIKEISDTNVKVSVTLGTEISKEIKDIYIETINLDPSYKAVAIGESSSKTDVIVKGTKNVVDAIDSSIITAQVDLSGYSEGDYEVTVKVNGDDNKATYTAKTTKIKVRITKK